MNQYVECVDGFAHCHPGIIKIEFGVGVGNLWFYFLEIKSKLK